MIRPLDLQILYMNLDKVSKETSLMKDAAAQAQANEALKLQKEQDTGLHSVGRTAPADGDDLEVKVNADSHAGTSPDDSGPPSEQKSEEDEKKPAKKPSWKDPQLGRHVDLSG